MLIIGGLQCVINTCLDIKSDGQQMEEEQDDDELNAEERIGLGKVAKTEGNKHGGFLGGLFGGGENNYFAPDVFADVKKCLYEKISNVLISCIFCWNHLDLFDWNDYHFTRFGMFAYYPEDNRRILEKMRIKRKIPKVQDGNKYDETAGRGSRGTDNDKYLTYEENLQIQTNAIQKKVIQLLRPIAKKIPD